MLHTGSLSCWNTSEQQSKTYLLLVGEIPCPFRRGIFRCDVTPLRISQHSRKNEKKSNVALPVTENTPHQTPPPPPATTLTDHTVSLTLIQHDDAEAGISPCFPKFTSPYTAPWLTLFILNRLCSQQTGLSTACLGYSFGFSSTHFAIRHTALPTSLLTVRLFPSCIRSLSVNIVLRIPLNDVRDPAAATWHPGGPWGSNRRDNPSQTPSCGKIWNPLPRVTASYFCSSNVISFRYSYLFGLRSMGFFLQILPLIHSYS